jgi:hypothetical protein
VTTVALIAVGILLYLAYLETRFDIPPAHHVHH